MNRVQSCPRVRKVMNYLLQQTQKETGTTWVGLSVIHLGDRDVPNALLFIDKYTQIPRFLTPLVQFLQDLPELCVNDERIHNYITEQFGSSHKLKLTVLADYFKHGFDGSGDDGGSCMYVYIYIYIYISLLLSFFSGRRRIQTLLLCWFVCVCVCVLTHAFVSCLFLIYI